MFGLRRLGQCMVPAYAQGPIALKDCHRAVRIRSITAEVRPIQQRRQAGVQFENDVVTRPAESLVESIQRHRKIRGLTAARGPNIPRGIDMYASRGVGELGPAASQKRGCE